jgi:hypothetical protein
MTEDPAYRFRLLKCIIALQYRQRTVLAYARGGSAMIKPVTGQYECQRSSGVGLDYFTSRIDRLTLQANGRFLLLLQDHSRIANAAQSLMSGQQMNAAAPETRREGNYTCQGNAITLFFDDGAQEQGTISWNGEGIQLGASFFTKVSDSTFLPPTNRLQKDMEDIAKGLKIAGTIGGFAMKAAKTIHNTIQATQNSDTSTTPQQGSVPTQAQQQPMQAPFSQPFSSPQQPVQPPSSQPYVSPQPVNPAPPPSAPYTPPQPAQASPETQFCDQCGARVHPGKRFCNNCGARLV